MRYLRDEDLIAINELIVACREAADRHGTVADLVQDRHLAAELSALGRDRAAVADELAEAVIAKDDIPNAPSEEKVLLEAAATRLKAAISRDDTLKLLEDCKAKEDRVAEISATSLSNEVEESLRQMISSLRADASSRLDALMRAYRPS